MLLSFLLQVSERMPNDDNTSYFNDGEDIEMVKVDRGYVDGLTTDYGRVNQVQGKLANKSTNSCHCQSS